MRILIIWGESLAKPGGGTVHFVGLADGLVRLGHGVTVITPRYDRAPLHTASARACPVSLPLGRAIGFGCFQLLTLLALPWWILRHRPGAIYVRTCFAQGAMAPLSRLLDVPLVGEVDSIVDEEIRMRGQPRLLACLVRAMDRCSARASSGLVCVTQGLRREMIRRGANPATTVAIPNGARTELMRPGDSQAARRDFDWPPERVVIAFAGAFAPWQGLDLLLDAAGVLRDRGERRILLTLKGDGRMTPVLRERIERETLGDLVQILPPGDQADVRHLLDACDGVVIPIHDRRKLAYGLSPLKFWDAVSMGLPVLVPAGGELEDTLADLRLPGVFDPDSAASLAHAMVALSDGVDRHRRARGDVHRAVDERYSWLAVARRVAAFLAERAQPGGES